MSTESLPVLYLNIIIHDGSEVVKAKVAKKVENSDLPDPIKKIAAKNAGKVASNLISPSTFAHKMGKKMCRKIPEKMKEKGLTTEMEMVFREGPFVVLQLQVQRVDTIALERANREEYADLTQDDDATSSSLAGALLEWSLKLIGQDRQKKLESDYLPRQVQEKLQVDMMRIMEEKFEEKNLKADVKILREEKQARFFYAKLKDLRKAMEEKERPSPIKEFQRNISSHLDDSDSDDF